MSLVVYYAVGLPCGFLLAFRYGWGLYGLWSGLSVAVLCGCVTAGAQAAARCAACATARSSPTPPTAADAAAEADGGTRATACRPFVDGGAWRPRSTRRSRRAPGRCGRCAAPVVSALTSPLTLTAFPPPPSPSPSPITPTLPLTLTLILPSPSPSPSQAAPVGSLSLLGVLAVRSHRLRVAVASQTAPSPSPQPRPPGRGASEPERAPPAVDSTSPSGRGSVRVVTAVAATARTHSLRTGTRHTSSYGWEVTIADRPNAVAGIDAARRAPHRPSVG